jgi:hypothetical protein
MMGDLTRRVARHTGLDVETGVLVLGSERRENVIVSAGDLQNKAKLFSFCCGVWRELEPIF